jgi:DNA-directed RNA polymerase specialized sigma24 family protein
MESIEPITNGDEHKADLNRLLLRLDSDPAIAWEKYRGLHSRLTKFFEWNQCAFPEELAEDVLDRVARKLENEEIRDVAEFVIGIARYVRLEAYKKNQRQSHIEELPGGGESLPDDHDREDEIVSALDHQNQIDALRECLDSLKPADRALALDYYSAEEEKQKVHRQRLATTTGLTMIALRVRANRLRDKLEKCVSSGIETRRRKRATREENISSHPPDSI